MDATEFWSGWWWPAATALLGFVFTWLVFKQWLGRRKPHQLAWTVGLLMYAVAALMESVSELMGVWNPTVYRFYIVLAASMVGYLGLGSYYLLAKKKTGPRIYLAFLLVCEVIFVWGVFTTELRMEKLVPGITVGGQALGSAGSFPRIMSLPFNITGTLFLLGGALISVWRFARKREFAYRMWANVLIAIGTLCIAVAGSMARAGVTAGLYPAEMVASAILLAGFLMAGTLDKGVKESIAAGQERRARAAAAITDDAAGTTPDEA
ncbi:MAG: hypothetical protein HGB10_10935 [Coriobacteriia bacterium]|nr:hypothetical protein [Coriobacteriia bacterium]